MQERVAPIAQTGVGVAEISAGVAVCTTGLGCTAGGVLITNGMDDVATGGYNYGQSSNEQTASLALTKGMGLSENTAANVKLGADVVTGVGAGVVAKSGKYATSGVSRTRTGSNVSSGAVDSAKVVENNFYRDDFQQFDGFRKPNAKDKHGNPIVGGNWDWENQAPNGGAVLGTQRVRTAQVGELFDRFGSEYGRYLGEVGTPLEKRSLPPGTNTPNNLHKYQVIKPFEITEETIAPAFNQAGGGTQIREKIPEIPGEEFATIEQLKKFGYLKDKK